MAVYKTKDTSRKLSCQSLSSPPMLGDTLYLLLHIPILSALWSQDCSTTSHFPAGVLGQCNWENQRETGGRKVRLRYVFPSCPSCGVRVPQPKFTLLWSRPLHPAVFAQLLLIVPSHCPFGSGSGRGAPRLPTQRKILYYYSPLWFLTPCADLNKASFY